MPEPRRRAKITVGGITFHHHHYDERGDVLYLIVGAARPAAHGLETPEGHAVHYDEHWPVIGLTLLNVSWTLERHGKLTLIWPPAELRPGELDGLLAAA